MDFIEVSDLGGKVGVAVHHTLSLPLSHTRRARAFLFFVHRCCSQSVNGQGRELCPNHRERYPFVFSLLVLRSLRHCIHYRSHLPCICILIEKFLKYRVEVVKLNDKAAGIRWDVVSDKRVKCVPIHFSTLRAPYNPIASSLERNSTTKFLTASICSCTIASISYYSHRVYLVRLEPNIAL